MESEGVMKEACFTILWKEERSNAISAITDVPSLLRKEGSVASGRIGRESSIPSSLDEPSL
jgi:hypothetical protein